MGVAENRAPRRTELLPTGQALIDPAPLVLSVGRTGNLRDAPDLATVNAAYSAFWPAHLFDVVQALFFAIFATESPGYVYELHGDYRVSKRLFCVKCIIAL